MLTPNRVSKFFLLAFQGIWAIDLLILTQSPYGLYEISDNTYWLLIINILFFSFGFLIRGKGHIKTEDKSHFNFDINSILTNKGFQCIAIIGCLITLYYFRIFLVASSIASSLSDVRTNYYSGELYGPLFNVFNGVFLQPLQILSYPLVVYGLLFNRKWVIIPLSIFLITYNSLTGGRFGYIKIFYSFIFLVCCTQQLNIKRIISLCMGAGVLFLLLSYVTAGRMESGGSVIDRIENGADKTLQHITTYACGASVALDHAINSDFLDRMDGYSYGGLTGSSVVQVSYIVLNKLGLKFKQPMEQFTQIKQNEYITVGPELYFNALYTSVLYFYMDFGILGVFFLPFIFGWICRFMIDKLILYNNYYLLVLVNYLFILTMFSITDYNFTSYTSLFVVIILYRLGIRKYKNTHLKL